MPSPLATSSHADRAAGQYLITTLEGKLQNPPFHLSLSFPLSLFLSFHTVHTVIFISTDISLILSVSPPSCTVLFPSVFCFFFYLCLSIYRSFSPSHSLLIECHLAGGLVWMHAGRMCGCKQVCPWSVQ